MPSFPAGSNQELEGQMTRVVVVGSTGSGKTTLARQLSRLLDAFHVELDALNWEADWTAAPTDVFRQRTKDALKGATWVVDGNYPAVRDLVWPKATTLIWLDYSLRVLMWRLLRRTLRRTLRKEELWNGNRERFSTQFLGRDSLFIWLLRTYWRRRNEFTLALEQPEHYHLEIVILRSPGATSDWLSGLEVT